MWAIANRKPGLFTMFPLVPLIAGGSDQGATCSALWERRSDTMGTQETEKTVPGLKSGGTGESAQGPTATPCWCPAVT